MGELRSGPDEPDDGAGDRAGRWDDAFRGDTGRGDAGAARQRVEPRSRAEYAADLEQRAAGGRAEVAVRPPEAEVLRRFGPGRAGLPEIGGREAAAYVEARCAERPWLAAARWVLAGGAADLRGA